MNVIPFRRKIRRIDSAAVVALPAAHNALAVARAIAPVQAEVNTAASLLTDLQSAVLSGAPMTELELGNPELIRALLTAAAHTCARSSRKADRELRWQLLRHLHQADADPAT